LVNPLPAHGPRVGKGKLTKLPLIPETTDCKRVPEGEPRMYAPTKPKGGTTVPSLKLACVVIISVIDENKYGVSNPVSFVPAFEKDVCVWFRRKVEITGVVTVGGVTGSTATAQTAIR